MICPKYKAAVMSFQGNTDYCDCFITCDEEECALWDKAKGQCCIKTLSELKISGGIKTFPIPDERR